MSGVYGAVGLDGRPLGARELAGLREIIAPLGPDTGDPWSGRPGRLGAALGAVGTAPLSTVDGDLAVVADAVLEDRRGLAGVLGLPADAPDATFVCAAYRRWGPECVAHLRGGFAFAVADARRGGVFIARDRLGIRPLHVYRTPRELVFASTAFALTGWDAVGSTVDEVRVAAFLYATFEPERTWVAGVRPVPPATALWVDGSGVHTRRYWRPALDATGPGRDHAQALREALAAAVADRAERGPVGVLLSGGLDSGSVAALAAAHGIVRTYTSVPAPDWNVPAVGNTVVDESELVRDLAARHPHLRPSFMDSRGIPLLDGHEESFAAGGTPAHNVLNVTWTRAFHARAAADGVRVLLHGGGGNFFFSPDEPGWLAALVRRGRWRTAAREAAHWSRVRGIPLRSVLRGPLLAELVPAAVRKRRQAAWTSAALRADGWLRPERRHLITDERLGATADFAWFASPVVLDALAAQAEFAAAEEARWGLCVSDPTLDLRVVEAACAQPAWLRRSAGQTRAVCRAATAGLLPDSIRLARGRGIQVADWSDRIADARPELLTEVAAARENPLVSGLVDLDAIAGTLAEWPGSEPSPIHRGGLLRALLASRYIRWFEEHSRPKARNLPFV
ncbi:asparagine synthetase B [Virgisporangium aliadipatigenens]|uniref:asparagine synthase (glutamine-hydrolyzing) n=1 Tax=Virgisporangium aliadipatigenens TaxID=741659 RepID=A0A8J3YW41_9ACTN|nr:asparagine synthase [Virgisporangium aliadipatigenens]GIJ51752.1 asparagine synthetase B [Virgisporangium aliadipatigenens]